MNVHFDVMWRPKFALIYSWKFKNGLFRFGVLTICPADGPVLTKEGPENSTFDPLRNDTLLLKLLLLKLF